MDKTKIFAWLHAAGVLSLLTSVAGLPELPDSDGDGIPDGADDSR